MIALSIILFLFSLPNDVWAMKEWTVMIYIAADNNLEGGAEIDLMQLEQVGSTDEVNFVVQVDRSGDYSQNTILQWSGAKRYYITKSTDPSTVTSEPVERLGDVNMACSETLIDFVRWASANYPANRYAFIFWNHGTGWKEVRPTGGAEVSIPLSPGMQAAMDNIAFNIAYDEGSNSSMDIPTLHRTLERVKQILGQKIDLLGYDACLMQMAEVAWAGRHFAKYQVASPDLEPEAGWPYDKIAHKLTENPYLSTKELGKIITRKYVKSYSAGSQGNSPVVLSVKNLARLESFRNSINQFSRAIINDIQYIDLIENARNRALSYSYNDYIDLGHFLTILKNHDVSPGLRSAARNLLVEITGDGYKEGLVIFSDHYGDRFAQTTGISIFFPPRSSFETYINSYSELSFARDTEWKRMLREFARPSLPYLKLEDTILADQNQDGRIEPGERVRVYISVENIGLSSIDSATIVCKSDSEYIIPGKISQTVYNMPEPQRSSLLEAFDFTVCETAPINTEITLNLRLEGRGIPDSTLTTTFYVREPFSSTGQALLILTDSSSPAAPVLQQMMSDANVSYDLWDRLHDGDIRTEVLRRYIDGWVFVAVQDSTPAQSLDEEEIDALDEFLAIGGRMVLNGQDIGFCLRDTEFLEKRCRAVYVQDDSNIHVVRGVNGFANNLTFNIFGGDGANNQKWPGEIDALPGAQLIFKYNEGARDMADDRYMVGPNHKPGSLSRGIMSSGGAALRVADGYRLLFFSFGIEAISNRSERRNLMREIVKQMQPNPITELRNLAIAASQSTQHRNVSDDRYISQRADMLRYVNRRLLNEIKELEKIKPGTVSEVLNAFERLPAQQQRLLRHLQNNLHGLLDLNN